MDWQTFLNSPLAVWVPILILVAIVIMAFHRQIGRLIERLTKTGVAVGKDGVQVDLEAQPSPSSDQPSSAECPTSRGVSVSGNRMVGWLQHIFVRHDSAEVIDNAMTGSKQGITVLSDSPLMTRLYQQITLNFSVNDLRSLSGSLGQDYNALPGAGIEAKTRALLVEVERQQRLPELVAASRRLHPELPWEPR